MGIPIPITRLWALMTSTIMTHFQLALTHAVSRLLPTLFLKHPSANLTQTRLLRATTMTSHLRPLCRISCPFTRLRLATSNSVATVSQEESAPCCEYNADFILSQWLSLKWTTEMIRRTPAIHWHLSAPISQRRWARSLSEMKVSSAFPALCIILWRTSADRRVPQWRRDDYPTL